MHALLPIHDKGLALVLRVGSGSAARLPAVSCGGAFFKLYYEGQVSPWLFVSSALAITVLLFAWWANSHLYRAPSSEVIPEFEDTHATAAARAATLHADRLHTDSGSSKR